MRTVRVLIPPPSKPQSSESKEVPLSSLHKAQRCPFTFLAGADTMEMHRGQGTTRVILQRMTAVAAGRQVRSGVIEMSGSR